MPYSKRLQHRGRIVRIRIPYDLHAECIALVKVMDQQTRLPGGITLSDYVTECLRRCQRGDYERAGLDPPRPNWEA